MSKVAVVQKTSGRDLLSKDLDFDYDVYYLCSDATKKKIYKKDVDINIDVDAYDWIILIGSEALSFFTKEKSVTEVCGKLVEGKFFPIMNPAMISFKPEVKKPYKEAIDFIRKVVTGELIVSVVDPRKIAIPIQDSKQAEKYLRDAINYKELNVVALDSETEALYPRNGGLLGISIAYCLDHAAYIDIDCFTPTCEKLLQRLVSIKTPIFHNAKFDLKFFEFHLKIVFPALVHDTMLMHYNLDERRGTHGLKSLAIKYTEFGNYEQELEDYKKSRVKELGILTSEFSYAYIPFDVMYPYASIDALATLQLYLKFLPLIEANDNLKRCYYDILLPGMRALNAIEDNGVPFDKDRLLESQKTLDSKLGDLTSVLQQAPEVKEFVSKFGEFNPNSPTQLRKLLFDYLNLPPTGVVTGTGAHSTNADVLEALSELHDIPKLILSIRKLYKIKSTYVDKIIPQLDRDSRLRTNYNLHMTTSGRLSSSGKLNMQQLPRDNPIVKGCIKARPGYKIVAMDLTTAEVYVAAVLSGDKALQNVFATGENFHSTIAKLVFNLPCETAKVQELYPNERQMAKAVTFGIMYGAGANRISAEVTKATGTFFSKSEAQELIDMYFARFKKLQKWLKHSENTIKQKGYVYSAFGRKRRLLNVKSGDRGVVGHEVRSGLNFLVQSVASDINLLAAIDLVDEIKRYKKDARIFGLVHDSVLAEVAEDCVDWYKERLTFFVEKDRGVSIPGVPIGTDFDVGDDYSMGKYEKAA